MVDKVAIINSYLDSNNPNINYIRLICQNKDDKYGLELDTLTKLKAERLAKKLNDEMMSDSSTIKIPHRFAIVFSNKNDIEPMVNKYEDNCYTYSYSVKYIHSCSPTKLVENCKYLFHWINSHGMLELINKSSEFDGIEMVFIDKSRNAYPDFRLFSWKNNIAIYQLSGYGKVLSQLGTSFELLLKKFYKENLFKKYGYPALNLNYPNYEDSWLNKCRILFPELDSVIKQYNTFVLYDEIDEDIIRLGKPLKMTDGKSLLSNKYYEINEKSSEFCVILNKIFNSNNLLSYIDPFKEKHYHHLFDFLNNEEVYYEFYEKRKRTDIDFLISHNIIKNIKTDDYLY